MHPSAFNPNWGFFPKREKEVRCTNAQPFLNPNAAGAILRNLAESQMDSGVNYYESQKYKEALVITQDALKKALSMSIKDPLLVNDILQNLALYLRKFGLQCVEDSQKAIVMGSYILDTRILPEEIRKILITLRELVAWQLKLSALYPSDSEYEKVRAECDKFFTAATSLMSADKAIRFQTSKKATAAVGKALKTISELAACQMSLDIYHHYEQGYNQFLVAYDKSLNVATTTRKAIRLEAVVVPTLTTAYSPTKKRKLEDLNKPSSVASPEKTKSTEEEEEENLPKKQKREHVAESAQRISTPTSVGSSSIKQKLEGVPSETNASGKEDKEYSPNGQKRNHLFQKPVVNEAMILRKVEHQRTLAAQYRQNKEYNKANAMYNNALLSAQVINNQALITVITRELHSPDTQVTPISTTSTCSLY